MIELMRRRSDAIHARWLDAALEVYPTDAAAFFRSERNRFANPVGQNLAGATRAMLDLLLGDPGEELDAQGLCAQLDQVLRVRAIQELTPSRAVRFVFQLKDAIRAELDADSPVEVTGTRAALDLVERRIDQMALFAFDIHARCREQVFQMRAQEMRRFGYAGPREPGSSGGHPVSGPSTSSCGDPRPGGV